MGLGRGQRAEGRPLGIGGEGFGGYWTVRDHRWTGGESTRGHGPGAGGMRGDGG